MKTTITILLIILFQSGVAQSIERYLKIAAENNPELRAKFEDYMAAMQKVPQVGVLPDPKLAFSFFVMPVETRNGSQQVKVGLSQQFPWFGTLSVKKSVANSMALAKYEIFEEAKSRLFYDVKSSYYNLFFVDKAMKITEDNIKILESFKNIALIKVEAGSASAVDELRVEMEIAELNEKLEALRDRYLNISVKFNKLLNRPTDVNINITDSLRVNALKLDKYEIIDSAMANNNAIQRFDRVIEAYKFKEKLARKNGKPAFSVGLDYIFIGESDNAMAGANSGKDAIVFPKIGVSIPLFRKKYNSMVKEAIHLQESSENLKQSRKNMLRTMLEMAYNDYKKAERNIKLHNYMFSLSNKSLKILESAYTTSGKNFEEILRMERKTLKHSLEIVKAKTDKITAMAYIDYLMGK